MKKQNVLHLVEYLYLGGIERLLEQLALNTNDKANVFFFTYETKELSGIGKQIEEQGFPVATYKKAAGRDWTLIKTLIQYIKENKIDVIHTHDFGPIEYAVILKLRFPWIKLIHTQHTIIHFVREKKYTMFFQIASYFYKRMIAVSQYVADTILEYCPRMKKSVLVVIANGVDTEAFKTSQINLDQKKLKLVSIARISREKNLIYLLKTCKLLKDANIPFEFHHAGTAKLPAMIDDLKNYISENNLSENVFLHGFTNDTLSILNKGDLFISASHTEGHPVAVLEAMSCEKLCFCSDISAHRELGEDIVILFDKEDEQALFRTLVSYQNDESAFDKEQRLVRGRKKVEEKFSIQNMVSNYVELYDR